MERRGFLKLAGLVSMVAQAGCRTLSHSPLRKGPSMAGFRADPIERLRVGVIGLGKRGPDAVKRLSSLPGVVVTALSDLFEDRVDRSAAALVEAGRPAPSRYFGSRDAWQRLCESADVDLVYICTPWLLHAPMAVCAMRCGKHAAVEVPAAVTVDQCWELVNTAEETRRHCMMLENCCYGFNELFALTLCRKQVLGDLVHAEAAYIHDLRASKLREEHEGGYQGQWRLLWSMQHTGNPYPTHGLGPVCQYLDINRGDRFDFVTSVSTAQVGLTLAAGAKYGRNSPQARQTYRLGDMNTSVIRTFRGRTILLQHDSTSPRPYTRLNTISGTRGILSDFPLRVALEPESHDWMKPDALEDLKRRYTHPLWADKGETARKVGGHGGMDYLMDMRLCHCLRQGLPLDIDVYDTALWSSLVELSERSVLRGGSSVTVPDFTRGGWKTAEPLDIVTV